MIYGIVNDRRQAFVTLDVIGTNFQQVSLAFLLDTGFNGGISLPQTIIQQLGLKERGYIRTQLADGSRIDLPVYQGSILWESKARPVNIVSTRGQPLLGMALVAGHQLTIDWVDGGAVIVRRLE